MRCGLYLTNKVYISNNKRINDEPTIIILDLLINIMSKNIIYRSNNIEVFNKYAVKHFNLKKKRVKALYRKIEVKYIRMCR